MRSYITLITTLLLFTLTTYSQKIPEGYLLQYQQNFSGGKALSDFNTDNPNKWGIFRAGNNFYLQCAAADSVSEIPSNLAILNNRVFGDFIIEADVMPVKDAGGFAEICLFLGIRNPSGYYYTQLANHSDSRHHGIFLVKNGSKTRLTGDFSEAVTWEENKWHKIRIERNIVRRTIIVYLDDMTSPLMQVKDYGIVMGSVGVGAFSGVARFDNIKIWAPTVISE